MILSTRSTNSCNSLSQKVIDVICRCFASSYFTWSFATWKSRTLEKKKTTKPNRTKPNLPPPASDTKASSTLALPCADIRIKCFFTELELRVPQLQPSQSGGEVHKQAAGGATPAAATSSLRHGNLLMISWLDGIHMHGQADQLDKTRGCHEPRWKRGSRPGANHRLSDWSAVVIGWQQDDRVSEDDVSRWEAPAVVTISDGLCCPSEMQLVKVF